MSVSLLKEPRKNNDFMLRKYAMPLLAPDAGPGGSSSPAAPAGGSPQPDSSATPAPTKEPSFAEVAQQAYDAATKAEGEGQEGKLGLQSDPDLEKEDGSGKEGEEQPKPQGEQGKEGGEPPKPVEKDPDDELPFHEHPRWKEVSTQRKEFEQRATTAETRLKEVEPTLTWVQNHVNFMNRYGISDQEFNQAMSILALQKSDPAQARQLLAPIWKSLEQYDENFLPPEVQQLVDDNEMTPTAAKSYAKLLAKVNGSEHSAQHTAQQQERNKAMSVFSTVEDWDRSKRGSDPDFKPKAKPEDPDGLWEMTAANYAYINTVSFADSPQKAQQNLEEAYKRAKAVVGRLTTVRTPTPPKPSSMRSSSAPKKKEEDMTPDEVVASVAAKHGISWSGRRSED